MEEINIKQAIQSFRIGQGFPIKKEKEQKDEVDPNASQLEQAIQDFRISKGFSAKMNKNI